VTNTEQRRNAAEPQGRHDSTIGLGKLLQRAKEHCGDGTRSHGLCRGRRLDGRLRLWLNKYVARYARRMV
jgi:hypothetical protein